MNASGIKIVLADDEGNILDVCSRYLRREGYEVYAVCDGEEAIRCWRELKPDLIVLDVMMPGRSGMEVCEIIREEDEIPILMLTAKGEEADRLLGLTMGADDYMIKPFSPRELVLRIKAILRRTRRGQPIEPMGELTGEEMRTQLCYPGFTIDARQRSVKVGDSAKELTAKEFELLWLLASYPGQVFSRSRLLDRIWDTSFEGDTTTVTVHISRLREKIEPNPVKPRFIKTVWGIGYKFEAGMES